MQEAKTGLYHFSPDFISSGARVYFYLGTAEPLVKQFRFSKYLLLTSVKSLFVVLFIPFLINIFTKIYVFRPLVEYFWDTKQTEIFLNYELQEKAFTEIRNFEEKIYFDYLLKSSDDPRVVGVYQREREESIFPGKTHALGWVPSEVTYSSFSPTNILGTLDTDKHMEYKSFEKKSRAFLSREDLTSKGCWENFSFPRTQEKTLFSLSSKQNYSQFFTGSNNSLVRSKSDSYDLNNPNNFFCQPSLMRFSVKHIFNMDSKEKNLSFISPSSNLIASNTIIPVNFAIKNPEGFPSSQGPGSVYFSKNTESIFRQKTRELAEHYNKESISALTNLLADFLGLIILLILLVNMKMSLMNTTAFLSESFFSLKDSKKAFLMLLFTDLLVGFHSPRGWEVIFHFLFEHFGLPENHNIIFLLVGTFPVLLDALFKYWIFRHLNRHSPATVATFQAMVE